MIRLLLVDDQEIVRDAIAGALAKHEDFQVVGTASSGAQALNLARELLPDIIVTETSLPDIDGIAAATVILEQLPQIRILALTTDDDQATVCQAMQAKFAGYVLKKCPFNQFVEAIRAVHSGQMYLSPQVVSAVVAYRRPESEKPQSPAPGHSLISTRERQVLQLVSEGFTTKEIADRLTISLKTVETHRRRVMAKLKIFSVAQLTKYAIREGLTTV